MTPSPPSAASHDPLAPHFVFDEELEIPDIPHPLQPLTGPGGRLILEGEAEDRPICLAGRRALVLGSELDGVHEVHVHPIPVLKEMETGLSPATSLRIGPGTIRRRIPDSEGPVLERVLALRELPGVVFQWIRAPEAEGPLELDLSWKLGPFAPSEEDSWAIRYRHLGPILRVALDPSGRGVLVFLSVAPREWEITCESTDAGSLFRVSASVRGERGDAIQLAVIGGTGSAVEQEDSLSALRFLGTQESRWETRERSSRQDSLRLVAPEHEVEEALEWAKARIDAAIIQDPQRGATVVTGYGPGINTGGDPDGGVVTRAPGEEEEIWAALGGLAAGHVLFARTVLADACNARTWNQGGELSVHAAPLFLYLVGQYVHWTGDSGILRSERQALDDAVSWCTTNLVPGSTPASVVRWSAGSHALAEAVEGLGGIRMGGLPEGPGCHGATVVAGTPRWRSRAPRITPLAPHARSRAGGRWLLASAAGWVRAWPPGMGCLPGWRLDPRTQTAQRASWRGLSGCSRRLAGLDLRMPELHRGSSHGHHSVDSGNVGCGARCGLRTGPHRTPAATGVGVDAPSESEDR